MKPLIISIHPYTITRKIKITQENKAFEKRKHNALE